MRVLIVDDERPARDKLRRLLEQEPDITAIGEARDGVDALEQLPIFVPDLLLLDIQMPEVNGLDVAASLPHPAPLVVFVTAYDDYAIRAFDANAIDYLLKPYDQQRLRRALDRARARLPHASQPGSCTAALAMATPLAEAMRLAGKTPLIGAVPLTEMTPLAGAKSLVGATLLDGATPVVGATPLVGATPVVEATLLAGATPVVGAMPLIAATPMVSAMPPAGTAQVAEATPSAPPTAALPVPTQLLVPERGGVRVVRVADIQWIETADNYVVLHTATGQPLMRQTLAGLLDKLGPRFVRCHRRAAVQLDWVTAVEVLAKGDGELLLRGGARVPCSRQFRHDVMARLQAGAAPGGTGTGDSDWSRLI